MIEHLNWSQALVAAQAKGMAHALITVLGVSGSTPRDQSSKMLVTAEHSADSIGGGHLEFIVMNKAREIMANPELNQASSQSIHHFPLGASLGQCCGGSASVLIEFFPAQGFHIAVFGAGHVAKALIPILGGLPCRVTWFDERSELFPNTLPENIKTACTDVPTVDLEQLPAGSDVLILTHNHQLDYDLCIKALEHPGLRSIGLIGSDTKAERFRKRLAHRGFDDSQIERIRCPVGNSDVPGKLPMEVAVSIAAELIAIEHQDRPAHNDRASARHKGLAWKGIKQQLGGEIDHSGQGYELKFSSESQDT